MTRTVCNPLASRVRLGLVTALVEVCLGDTDDIFIRPGDVLDDPGHHLVGAGGEFQHLRLGEERPGVPVEGHHGVAEQVVAADA